MHDAPTSLECIAEELAESDAQLKLEILLDYALALPVLSSDYCKLRDAGLHTISECQSPVFLMVEVRGGRVVLNGDVPAEAPTPRSFVAILIRAFDRQPVQAVLDAPTDLLEYLGLTRLVGLRRVRGLRAIYAHLRREVQRQASKD